MTSATSPQAPSAQRHSPLPRKDDDPMNRAADPLSRMELTTPAKAVGAAWAMVIDVVRRQVGAGHLAVTAARSPKLSEVERALVSIAIQAHQECGPCLAFYESIARSAGADEVLIEAARLGTSSDLAVATLIEIALAVHASSTTIMPGQVVALRNVGYSNREIADAVLVVAQNVVLCAFHLSPDFHTDSALRAIGSCQGIAAAGGAEANRPAPSNHR